MGLYQYITGSNNLNFYGGGFWTWFNDGQACTNCQENAVYIQNTTNMAYFGVSTRALDTMIVNNGDDLVTQYYSPGGWGGVTAAFLTDL